MSKCVCGAMRSEHHAASIYCAPSCERTKCTEFCPLREARLLGPDPAFAAEHVSTPRSGAPDVCACGAHRNDHHGGCYGCPGTGCREFKQTRLLSPDHPEFARMRERGLVDSFGRAVPAVPAALPHDRDARKATPIASGVLAYFPRALAAVAHCSKVGNDQHNPGESLHWAREKSQDEPDALVRHLIDHLASGEVLAIDTDGVPHLAKVAWRALAFLEKALEAQQSAAAPASAPPQEVR